MPITVVTIDFWNTLFDSTGGPHRNDVRRRALHEAIVEAGLSCELEDLEKTYTDIWSYFDDHWLNHQRTPTSGEMVREIYARLGLDVGEALIDRVAEIFERGVLDHPPVLLPGVREGLEYLSGRARLALISDTAFSPGSILRELMELNGIARYFEAFSFSDETGVAKPHPEAFARALAPFDASPAEAAHIGDIERTDIVGARRAGMRAILYRGDSHAKYAEQETAADAILSHWSEISSVIEGLERPAPDEA